MTSTSAITRTTSGPGLGTLARLALVGSRTDRLRMGLSAIGTAIATGLLLAATNVVRIGPLGRNAQRYTTALLDERGLHVGVITAMLALTIPLIAFVGQCVRIGAPARDRRLALLRMSGVTGGEVRKIVLIETAIAALGGAILGSLIFAIGRSMVSTERNVAGELRLPVDVSMPVYVYAVIVAAVAVLAVGSTLLALRKTIIDPFGVTRHRASAAPTALPFAALVAGLLGLVFFSALVEIVGSNRAGNIIPLIVGFAALMSCGIGLTFGAAALSQRVARFVRTRTSQPAWILAAGRIEATPFRASRNLGAVLLAVMIGAGIQQVREGFLIATDPADRLYADTFQLLDYATFFALIAAVAGLLVAAAEGITERRRTLAALVAAGTPRSTLARSVLAEVMIPLVPGVLAAAVTGTLAGRGFVGTEIERGGTDVLVRVPIPWAEVALLAGGSIVLALAISSLALFLLPASVSPSELRAAT